MQLYAIVICVESRTIDSKMLAVNQTRASDKTTGDFVMMTITVNMYCAFCNREMVVKSTGWADYSASCPGCSREIEYLTSEEREPEIIDRGEGCETENTCKGCKHYDGEDKKDIAPCFYCTRKNTSFF